MDGWLKDLLSELRAGLQDLYGDRLSGLYAKTLDSLVRSFQEGPPENRERSWIRDEYVDFFVRAQAADVLAPLVYRALSGLDLPGGEEWLAHNSSRVAALEEWLAGP